MSRFLLVFLASLYLISAAKSRPIFMPTEPLSTAWQWWDRPLNGKVVSTIVQTKVVDGSGTFGPETTAYFSLPDGGTRVVRNLDFVVDRDSKGRITRIVSVVRRTNAQTGKSESVDRIEIPHYGDNGTLDRVLLQEEGVTDRTVEISKTDTEGGNYALRWVNRRSPSKELSCELLFDANNRVIRWHNDVNGLAANRPFVFEYNDKGDVKKESTGPNSIDEYEYKYDDRDNWIQCERTITRFGTKKLINVSERTIKYGDIPAVPANKLVVAIAGKRSTGQAPSTKPAADDKNSTVAVTVPEPKKGAEQFRKTMGRPGSSLYVEMTITLNPDKTGTLVTVSEFQKQLITKVTTASWELQGNDVAIELEKSLTGEEIPEAIRVMHFSRSAEGDLILGADAKSPFKKLKATD